MNAGSKLTPILAAVVAMLIYVVSTNLPFSDQARTRSFRVAEKVAGSMGVNPNSDSMLSRK
jgi:hypothetical protein